MQLNRLTERLSDAGIDFIITGSFAGVLHGLMLVTRALEVCVVLSAENVARLREVFRDLRPRHRFSSPKLSFLDNPEPGASLNNLYLETELGPIDLLGSVKGVGDFERVRADSIEIELFGRRCRVMSLDTLIQAKQAMGRDKDLIALKELRVIAEKQRQQ